MRYALSLEWIGADHAALYKVCGVPYDGPWVARITWDPANERMRRDFQKAVTDYTDANSVGSRGVMRHYALAPGLYEVKARTSWKNSRRYFLRVNPDGTADEILNNEALTWAQENCWEPMY